jgi:hypothetical protein
VQADPLLHKKNPDSPLAVVRIRCRDGRELSERVRTIRGDPEDTLSIEECASKFRECASFSRKRLSRARTEKLLQSLLELEAMPDMRELGGLLR